MVYGISAKGDICIHKPASENHPRGFYYVDKARSLQLLCSLIRLGAIRFFKYDYKSSEEPGLIREFMAIREEKIETVSGQVYRISRRPGKSCDFVDATNYASLGIWHTNNRWPNLITAMGMSD